MRAVIIPYRDRWEVFCPRCEKIAQEYHPVERWGYCGDEPDGCGFAWRFPPYRKPLPPVPGIDYPGIRPRG